MITCTSLEMFHVEETNKSDGDTQGGNAIESELETEINSDVNEMNTKGMELPFVAYTVQDNKLHSKIVQCSHNNHHRELSWAKPITLSNSDNNKDKLDGTAPSTVILTPLQKNLITSSKQNLDRTPKTILRMMERHRENERVRHHTLNRSMKVVCSKVPGLSSYIKETKVVMMQRIISYICFVENTISNLCDSLSIKVNQLKLPSNLIIDQWKEMSAKSRNFNMHTGFRPYKNRYRNQKVRSSNTAEQKDRLKLSSPTIDSTTDNLEEPSKLQQTSFMSTWGSLPSTSSMSPVVKYHGSDMDVLMESNACTVPDSMEDTPDYFNEEFLPSSNSFDNFPDAFDLVSSPLGGAVRSRYVLLSPKVKAMDNVNIGEFGIKSDDGDLIDTGEFVNSHEMRTISPECVLPTTPLPCTSTSCLVGKIDHTPLHASSIWQLESQGDDTVLWHPAHRKVEQLLKTPDKNTLLKNKNKRKQYTPQRSPFSNITNFENKQEEPEIKKLKTSSQHTTGRIVKPSAFDGDFVSYVPYIWKFHNMAITRRQKAEVARLQAETASSVLNSRNEKQCNKPLKIDHRKTTWMNGFMMFSRLNRRQFIVANPGVHTSHISKMMGHAWRNMSTLEQQPYKEKAREYARCIKHDVDLEIESPPPEDSAEVSSSGMDNDEEDSADMVLHNQMVPFRISSPTS